MIRPTQAAREAAAKFVEACRGEGFRAGHHHDYRAGKGDASKLVQAFATFERETVAKLIERVLAQEDDLTRPIIGIDNRTALEAFDIMHDRIVRKFSVIRNLTDGSQ